MHDAVIVGAGPAGNSAAFGLARKGYDVVVLEAHEMPGQPRHCTGLVTDSVLSSCIVKPEILSTINGADVVFPDGGVFEIRSKNPIGKIIDRVGLDVKMAEAAMNAGADYRFNNKYVAHTVKENQVVVESDTFNRAKVLIGADGSSSSIANSLNPENRPMEIVRGLQADVGRSMEQEDIMKIYIGNDVAPGFFAWEIPCGEFTRVGLCTKWAAGPPTEYLMNLLIKLGYQNRVISLHAGKIPLGGRSVIYGDRCLVTGDAAGMAKPISGGGLYPIFKSNDFLVSTVVNSLESNDFSSKALSVYGRKWKEEFGKEYKKSYNLRKRFKRFSDADLNRAYEFCERSEVHEALNEIDIDHPSDVMKKLIRKPKTLFAGLPVYLRTI